MPELPEVQTMVNDLNRKVIGRKISRVWVGWAKTIKYPKDAGQFEKVIIGEKILFVDRLGKYIKFNLSGGKAMLAHLKMTGHFLIGKWEMVDGRWVPEGAGAIKERVNSHIRVMFYLSGDEMLGFCDVRKFGTLRAGSEPEIMALKEIKELGRDIMAKDFHLEEFAKLIGSRKSNIKKVLLDQTLVSGTGNIYSDEALWKAKIHPLRRANSLSQSELRDLWDALHYVLDRSLKLRGTTSSDYRDIDGEAGGYWEKRLVYRREGEKCPRCGAPIKRIVIGARSAHYCPKCQIN